MKFEVAYDGAQFSGWAPQEGRRTVAGVLAETLGRVLRLPEPPKLTVAGRTDAGVHARGQVAHADLPASVWAAAAAAARGGAVGRAGAGVAGAGAAGAGAGDAGAVDSAVAVRGAAVRVGAAGARTAGAEAADAGAVDDVAAARLLRRLARALPPDIRVRAVAPVPPEFDARFSALWRRYSYRVCDDVAAADPLRRHDTLWHFRPLDLDAMNAAASELTGEHDFAAFCRRREGATTVRALRRLDWRRDEDGIAVACVIADAFCHNMVRSLVGVLLPVGEGARPVSWPSAVLAAGARDPAVRTAPPHPLCLEEVRYPADADLAARSTQTRRLRSLTTPDDKKPSSYRA